MDFRASRGNWGGWNDADESDAYSAFPICETRIPAPVPGEVVLGKKREEKIRRPLEPLAQCVANLAQARIAHTNLWSSKRTLDAHSHRVAHLVLARS